MANYQSTHTGQQIDNGVAGGLLVLIPTASDAGKIPKVNSTGTAYEFGEQYTPLAATVTIAVADWSNGTCTKSVTGVTASNIVIVDPSDANVQCTAQGAGTLIFTASETPSEAVTVKVVILP